MVNRGSFNLSAAGIEAEPYQLAGGYRNHPTTQTYNEFIHLQYKIHVLEENYEQTDM